MYGDAEWIWGDLNNIGVCDEAVVGVGTCLLPLYSYLPVASFKVAIEGVRK